jgi:hypothetical protein
LKPFIALGAAIVLAGLAGCTSDTLPANGRAGEASRAKASVLPQRWCADQEWLSPAARLYESAYRNAPRPITPATIDAGLAAGGALQAMDRRTAGRDPVPVTTNTHDLREFLVSVAEAEAAGTDPLKYAKHIVAICES